MQDTTTTEGPLVGLKVIEISTYVAGPSGAMTLAQLGAEVIRIDPPGGATDTRRLPLDSSGHSLYWAGLNKGKRSIEINTRTEKGRELVGQMLEASGPEGGILLTNAVGQRWLDYESLTRWRSDLIEVHITGRSDGKPAVDYTVNCEVGLPLITGPADYEVPVNHVLPAWDLLTGQHAALGILAAERKRQRTGKGSFIEISLADAALATMGHLGFIADVVINSRDRLRDGNYLYGSFGCDFQTADGGRVMIVALTEGHWWDLVELTGIGDAISALEKALDISLTAEEERYHHREVLSALMKPWFAQRSTEEVTQALEKSHVLWGPYRSIEQLVRDPDSLLHHSDLMVEVEHPGIGSFPTPRSVLSFEELKEQIPVRAPAIGEHTDQVLSEVCGLDDSALAALRSEGVIGGRQS